MGGLCREQAMKIIGNLWKRNGWSTSKRWISYAFVIYNGPTHISFMTQSSRELRLHRAARAWNHLSCVLKQRTSGCAERVWATHTSVSGGSTRTVFWHLHWKRYGPLFPLFRGNSSLTAASKHTRFFPSGIWNLVSFMMTHGVITTS